MTIPSDTIFPRVDTNQGSGSGGKPWIDRADGSKSSAGASKKTQPSKSQSANPSSAAPGGVARPNSWGYITFNGFGWGTSGTGNGPSHAVTVLCGDTPPTVTAGYATWQSVQRPLTQALTVFQGYDPIQLECNVRFGIFDLPSAKSTGQRWITEDFYVGSQKIRAGDYVENTQIKWFEWMAGYGFSSGPSPIVWLGSAKVKGVEDGLIPGPSQNQPHAIVGVEWGTAYRNPRAERIYQEAKVTLMRYENFQKAPGHDVSPGTGSVPSGSFPGGKFFKAKPKADTPMEIATAVLGPNRTIPSLVEKTAKAIVHAKQNSKLKLRGITQKIKDGTDVYVPAS